MESLIEQRDALIKELAFLKKQESETRHRVVQEVENLDAVKREIREAQLYLDNLINNEITRAKTIFTRLKDEIE